MFSGWKQRAIYILLLSIIAAVVWPSLRGEGLEPGCGDVGWGEEEQGRIRELFVAGGQIEPIAPGRTDRLDAAVESRVLSAGVDCRIIVDAANDWIAAAHPEGSALRAQELTHFIVEIGPYYALRLRPAETGAPARLLVIDRATLSVVGQRQD